MSEPAEQPAKEGSVAFVMTDRPVPLSVTPIEDDRTPDGMTCLGTSLSGHMVARCVVPPEVAEFIAARGIFVEPVRLALAAQEAPPGLQCRLFALVTVPAEVDEDEPEPWAASVPSSDYDRVVRAASEAETGGGDQQAAVLLGHIIRFARDRRHPGDLALEAGDILATIVAGRVSEVVDRALEDLLGSA